MVQDPSNYNEFEKEFAEAKKEINKMKFPLIFMQKRHVDKQKDQERIRKYGNHYLTTVITYHSKSNSNNGQVTWTFSPTQPEKKDGKSIFGKNNEIVPSGGLIVTKNEIDKAFYLLYKSLDFKVGYIILDDKEKIAAEKVNEERAIVDAKALLYGSNTLLVSNKLKTLGRAYGIVGVSNLSDDEIRVQLDLLLANKYKQDKQVYIQFVRDANLSQDLKIRSIIQQAIEQRVTSLTFGENFAWVTRPEDPKKIIYNFLHEDFGREMSVLVDFFKSEGTEIYDKILASLGVDEDVPVDFSLKGKDEALYKAQIKQYAKKNGIKVYPTKKFEEVESEVKQHLENKESLN